tara:strand:+ start:116 stop:325 length:210 start_codon:yes stop_codon:yes gene_type:complete
LDIDNGDLVVTLQQVESIHIIPGTLSEGMIGIVVAQSAEFNHVRIYGVAIEGHIYYLFEDEIKKLEKQC